MNGFLPPKNEWISAPFMGKKCRPKTPIGIPYYSSSNQNEWVSAPSNLHISAPLKNYKKWRPKTAIGLSYYSSSDQNEWISAPSNLHISAPLKLQEMET